MYWARQKISALMDESYKGAVEDTIRKSVLDVALAHHLVSQYTSLVAVDITPARPTDIPGAEQDRATNLAQAQALAGLPKTATIGQLQIVIGLAGLMFAALLWGYRRAVG